MMCKTVAVGMILIVLAGTDARGDRTIVCQENFDCYPIGLLDGRSNECGAWTGSATVNPASPGIAPPNTPPNTCWLQNPGWDAIWRITSPDIILALTLEFFAEFQTNSDPHIYLSSDGAVWTEVTSEFEIPKFCNGAAMAPESADLTAYLQPAGIQNTVFLRWVNENPILPNCYIVGLDSVTATLTVSAGSCDCPGLGRTSFYAFTSHGPELHLLDCSSNWLAAPIGNTGLTINSADFSPDGRLFVVGEQGLGVFVLAQIDRATGQVISTIPFPESTAETIAFDANGLLSFVSNYTQLKTFDLYTGNVTPLPQPIGFGEVQGIDFHPDGTLYGISSFHGGQQHNILIEIDTTTGVGTSVCPLDPSVLDINSLDIDACGRIHALTTVAGNVYHIDPVACTATIVGDTTSNYGALASLTQAVECIPGDMNGDGLVDGLDVQLFVNALLDG